VAGRCDQPALASGPWYQGPPKPEHPPGSRVASTPDAATRPRHQGLDTGEIEGTMATRQQRQIVETPTEARQAEPGPSVLALLTVSTGLAVLILGVVWFVFFRG
jgi:hypothetical protein